MTITTPAPPPITDELERLCRRLRVPYLRKHAAEVIATATSQRWDPTEVLRVLLAEEETGRDRATIQMRRRSSGLPAGKTFDAWVPALRGGGRDHLRGVLAEIGQPQPTAESRELIGVWGRGGCGDGHAPNPSHALVDACSELSSDRPGNSTSSPPAPACCW